MSSIVNDWWEAMQRAREQHAQAVIQRNVAVVIVVLYVVFVAVTICVVTPPLSHLWSLPIGLLLLLDQVYTTHCRVMGWRKILEKGQ